MASKNPDKAYINGVFLLLALFFGIMALTVWYKEITNWIAPSLLIFAGLVMALHLYFKRSVDTIQELTQPEEFIYALLAVMTISAGALGFTSLSYAWVSTAGSIGLAVTSITLIINVFRSGF